MPESSLEEAKKEIHGSLKLCYSSLRNIGLSFERPKTVVDQMYQNSLLLICVLSICYHLFSDLVFMGVTLSESPRLEDIVPYFHTFGYGVLSVAKIIALWFKRDVFVNLIQELSSIWPVSDLDEEAQEIKNKSLFSLRFMSTWYWLINVSGIYFYSLTPIVVYFYEVWQGRPNVEVGFMWASWYPFDKRQPMAHVAVYIFEVFVAYICVFVTIGSDLLFWAMASHISLLLRLLHNSLEATAASEQSLTNCYQIVIENVKVHQRLVRYCDDLEDTFSVSIFVNYIFSSFNICCVVFVVMLFEPFLMISNKLFLVSALIQIGMICWYGDEIMRANLAIVDAAYNCGWYRMDPKCRRALLFLIIRAEKPIAITAMKFTNISLATYSSILSRSYSYFAILYTMYKDNDK